MTLKEQATQNLKDIKKILDEMQIPFWLDAGTLLGAYRDKDFCDGDEDDTDLCTWENYLIGDTPGVAKTTRVGIVRMDISTILLPRNLKEFFVQ